MRQAILQGIASIFLVGLLSCEREDIVESVYADLQAAKDANAVGLGKWIPPFTPLAATSIRDKHNLDTNEGWVYFRTNPKDIDSLRSNCTKESADKLTYPRKSPGSWWPSALLHGEPEGAAGKSNFEFYDCDGGAALAIEATKAEVYYWVLAR